MINILVADDHQLLIDGIKAAVAGIPDFCIVAEAHNGQEVIGKLEAGIEVDIILMDVNMPLMDGLDCTKLVNRQFPDIKIIALTQYNEKRFVKMMMKNGARGYLLKDTGKDTLEKAIRQVINGESFFTDGLYNLVIRQELKMEQNSYLFPNLTDRETEILRLIGQEKSSQEIADKLFLSMRTVERHRANILNKAGVKNTAGLIRWAVENNLLE